MNRLTKFFEELRELPRHLQEFCERFLMQRSGFEARGCEDSCESITLRSSGRRRSLTPPVTMAGAIGVPPLLEIREKRFFITEVFSAAPA